MNFMEIVKQRSVELAFLGVSVVAVCVAMLINGRISEQLKYYEGFTYKEADTSDVEREIVVDVEGAVVQPGVYRVNVGARLDDVIKKAGGLSKEADLVYLQQYVNRAQSLSDQQKIYIPTVKDVKEMEKSGEKSVLGMGALAAGGSENAAGGGLNINTATADELDGLPGIGAVTVEKIVSGRPYTSIDELKDKKIISASQFEAIKDLISAL